MRCTFSLVALMFSFAASAFLAAADEQPQFAKPGPEHAELMKLAGTWDAVMKMASMPEPMPAVAIYKVDCDGMWLASEFKMDAPAFKFQGRGLDGYDQNKKKYVSIWVDSMSSSPMLMEGTNDAATNTTTMTGTGPGHDGKPQKFKAVTKVKDNDHMTFEMFMVGDDGKETSAFTIDYTRRKAGK
jgi:hypothetical protein